MKNSTFDQSQTIAQQFVEQSTLLVHPGILHQMNGDCSRAVVLSYLVSTFLRQFKTQLFTTRLRKNNLWFKCPAKKIQLNLGISQSRQRKSLQILTSVGFIEVRHGAGNALWIKINSDTVSRWLDIWNDRQE